MHREVFSLKIVCNRDELSTALISICRIIPSRTNLPILNGCLITAENQTLSLRSTDLELTLEINIPVQVEEEGSTVVLAAIFSDRCAECQVNRYLFRILRKINARGKV